MSKKFSVQKKFGSKKISVEKHLVTKEFCETNLLIKKIFVNFFFKWFKNVSGPKRFFVEKIR